MSRFVVEERGSNSYLVYTLGRDEIIDEAGLGMISNNKMPDIVPVSYTQYDNDRYLQYNFSSLVSLKQYLNGIITKRRALAIFEGITHTLLTSEGYFLDANMLVLDPECIFVDNATGKTKMIYLAVINGGGSANKCDFFRSLLMMLKPDQNDDCSYLAALITYLNGNPNLSIRDFHSFVAQLQAQTLKGAVPPTIASGVSSTVKRETQTSTDSPEHPVMKPHKKKIKEDKDEAATTGTSVQRGQKTTFEIPGGKKVVEQDSPATQQTDSAENGEGKNLMWLLQNFSMDNLKAYREGKASQEGTPKKKEEKKKQKQQKKSDKKEKDTFEVPNGRPASISTIPTSWDDDTEEDNELEATAGMGGDGEETVDINDTLPKQAYLIRESTRETIKIDQEIFLMGRSPNKTSYCITGNPAIGRKHAVIIRRNAAFYIIDLESKNKTYVDGVIQVPNTENELVNGSVITLANENFQFIIE